MLLTCIVLFKDAKAFEVESTTHCAVLFTADNHNKSFKHANCNTMQVILVKIIT